MPKEDRPCTFYACYREDKVVGSVAFQIDARARESLFERGMPPFSSRVCVLCAWGVRVLLLSAAAAATQQGEGESVAEKMKHTVEHGVEGVKEAVTGMADKVGGVYVDLASMLSNAS